jgi:hypothetical protein
MTHVMAKEDAQGSETGVAGSEDPAICQEQVIAYIVGDMAEDAYRNYVAHVRSCGFCLEQIVLWRMAEGLAKEGGRH